jgi:restriction system protein
MPRQGKREDRAQRRRAEAAIKLLMLGGGFVLVPLFMGNSPFGKAFASLMPIGFLMLAIGGVLLWLARRDGSPRPPHDASAFTVRREPRLASPFIQESTGASRPFPLDASERPLRPTTWSSSVFEVIEWRRFEAVIEALFKQAGFETKTQSHGADQGVDVWLYSKSQPGEAVSIVQCKHWQGKRVGVDKIRELRGVMAAHNVQRGQFATTSTFTPDAVAFAQGNAINLLNVTAILALIAKRTTEQQQSLLAVALQGDYWRPTCVNCGDKLIERSPKKGGTAFWGCTNYPRCKTTMPMRGAA